MTCTLLATIRRALGPAALVGFHATRLSASGTAIGMEKNGGPMDGLGKNGGPLEPQGPNDNVIGG